MKLQIGHIPGHQSIVKQTVKADEPRNPPVPLLAPHRRTILVNPRIVLRHIHIIKRLILCANAGRPHDDERGQTYLYHHYI